MTNLKDIREVPELESLSGTEKVLVNANGEAKQASVSLIKQPTKELMYEWNFSVEDDVWSIDENINDDIFWLTNPSEYEIEVSVYGGYYNGKGTVINPEVVVTSSGVSSVYMGFCEGIPDDIPNISTIIEIYSSSFSDSVLGASYHINCYLTIYPGYHYNSDEDNFIAVNKGGNIYIESDNSPFKSIKIYKITR